MHHCAPNKSVSPADVCLTRSVLCVARLKLMKRTIDGTVHNKNTIHTVLAIRKMIHKRRPMRLSESEKGSRNHAVNTVKWQFVHIVKFR